MNPTRLSAILCLSAVLAGPAAHAQTHIGDVTIAGSLCVGFDCTAGMGFGFDTVILKENNLRMLFDDTSNTASFPSNDWRLTANDSANGGNSYFSIDDASAGRVVFRIFAGARSNALVVDSQGDVGLGTSTPALDLTIVSGNTPSLRLEQDGSGGFAPQIWDVAGNEAGFFIRDATGGSTLPLRIQPGGAPSSSLAIASDGDIGLGLFNPDGPLHIRDDSVYITLDDANDNDKWYLTHQAGDGGALEFTSELNGSGTYNVAFVLEPDGDLGLGTGTPDGPLHLRRDSVYITLDDANDNDIWYLTHQAGDNGNLEFTSQLNGGGFNVAAVLQPNGNMTLDGVLTQNSDKNAKMAVAPVDAAEILAKVTALPVAEWSYTDAAGVRHVGPMAQDFHALFGLGATDTGISTLDTSGVALAAIQALAAENAALKAELAEQAAAHQALIADLATRLRRLETAQTGPFPQ